MKTAWYRKLFSPPDRIDLQATRIKANQGDADAQFALGVVCANGKGALQDFVRAAEWYRKAADQDHALAQFNLGLMYAEGQGVPCDDAEGVRWIRRAAEQGDAGAQFNLGTRYHRASIDRSQMDAVESRIEAYKWFQLAADQGYKDAEASCHRMTLSMSREEVAEGNHRMGTFVAGKPSNS
jgi:hypothetical protein